MLHAFMHYGSIVAFIASGICGFGLIFLFAAAVSVWREQRDQFRNLVWEVPAVAFAITAFWLTVGLWLTRF